ncbi:HNH endonuclease signature motif containing protein, partial [Corynebacterium flavescens]
KQRTMLAAEHPTCAWPGCTIPAERGQFHHLTPWKHGGETNVANLVTLCSYHNGINEDDPNAPPRRGRLTRKGGTIVWQPPHAH